METEIDYHAEGYVESLARTRQYLVGSPLLGKLDEVIAAEIELAMMGAEKAKSNALKANKENNVTPIK